MRKRVFVIALLVALTFVISGCGSKPKPVYYTLNIDCDENGGTTDPAPGEHQYEAGTLVAIRTVPEKWHRFWHWGGDDGWEVQDGKILMTGDKNVTAWFTDTDASVSVQPAPDQGTAPLSVHFDVITTNFDGPVLRCRWIIEAQNGGVQEVTTPVPELDWTFTDPDLYAVGVYVYAEGETPGEELEFYDQKYVSVLPF